ncbi:MAG: tRNA (guanosine(37)-N1)-methyltransferase TrmD, partial [Planctomycetota bacterium]|nr:tRNA (guanosine(37)-N1)-methyltransferase TrmD [Planctomycetota bacterium]
MRIDIVTIFPKMFEGVFAEGIVRIAGEKKLLDVRTHDLRDYSGNKHRKVDDAPYGGGPGMVMTAEPILRCVETLSEEAARAGARKPRVIVLTPQGRKLDHGLAVEYALEDRLVLICGHYEGIDERVVEILRPDELSLGDFVLSGGEIPAMALVDAVARQIPGVLGDPESLSNESFVAGMLDYPHYTRPRVVRGMKAPEVLFSGNHAEIEKWRRAQSNERTRARRRDLGAKP